MFKGPSHPIRIQFTINEKAKLPFTANSCCEVCFVAAILNAVSCVKSSQYRTKYALLHLVEEHDIVLSLSYLL